MPMDLPAAAAAVAALLDALGVDEGEHTADTPNRVARSWAELLAGYDSDPALELETTFPAPPDPGLVVVAGIRLQSTCAHHLLPFTGTATVAYRPTEGARIVGLSKLSRVVAGYARRLQVQEQIGAQVAHAVMDKLHPGGVAVLITSTHQCMTLRGACDDGAVTTTVSLGGHLTPEDSDTARAEHLAARAR